MTKTVSFESALKQLESIVQELEKGELPLEKAIKRYEEGIRLSRYCTDKLDETEQRISMLVQNEDGTVGSVPFQGKVREAT